MSMKDFMLSRAEHEKSFITLGPDLLLPSKTTICIKPQPAETRSLIQVILLPAKTLGR